MTRDLKYIHFWKKELTSDELEKWLDKLLLYNKRYWLILLDEKLTRNEI